MKITRDDDFGGAVLNCAVRYCLGRLSYMPGLVMGQIRPMLPDCSDKTLWCFEKDISEWLDGNSLIVDDPFGDCSYEADWTRFLEAVRAEIERRRSSNG